MKKIFGFLLATLCIQTASAEVTFFNKSTQSNIEVTYQYCYYDAPKSDITCTEKQTLMINQKSYLTIQVSQLFPIVIGAGVPYVQVNSAVGRDGKGNIISKGSYENYNHCRLDIQKSATESVNVGFELDDYQSPIILCRASSY